MSNRIRIARGTKANKPTDLLYGEFYWEKIAAGTSEGVLYMGAADGTSGDVAIGGARAMKSWYYKGTYSTVGSFPANPVMGDMYLVGADGAGSAVFKAGDMMIYDGTSAWLRINNVGGNADQTAYDNTLSSLAATNVQNAIDELSQKRFQYGSIFAASSGAYPSKVKPGQFYISGDIGTVDGTPYKKGDAAFYDGTTWAQIPFSMAFPADGIQGTGTANTLSKFDSANHIVDSNITDNGSAVGIGVNTTITGFAQATTVKVGDGVTEQVTLVTPTGVGNIAVTLPSAAGHVMRTEDHFPASQVDYTHTGTSIVATDVQAALSEMAKGKMAYAGTIASGTMYPSSPVIGGLYLLTADLTLALTSYVKGDWAFYDGSSWTRIPAGYTDAINTSFDNTGVKLGDGTTAVTETNIQAAIAYLYGNKADLVGGKVPTSQLPSYIVGGMSYIGTWDPTANSGAYPSTGGTGTGGAPGAGNYWVVSKDGTAGGNTYTVGDWIVYSGSAWQLLQGGGAVDTITVGSNHLQNDVEFVGVAPITVGVVSGAVSIGANVATGGSGATTGVVKIGDGISVDPNGLIAVDATNGLHIDSTSHKLEAYLNTNGLEIDLSQQLGIKAGTEFTFSTGSLILAATGVTAGTYPKLTVNAKGQITSGGALLVSDVPVYVSGAAGATEIYNATNGVVAGLKVVGPVSIAKSADLITLDFTQTNAVTLSANFATNALTAFNWSGRNTGTDAITSIVGAVNANRDDLSEYVVLLGATGRAAGAAGGANLVGTKGIAGVTPVGGAPGANASLQAMLEGMVAYTDTQIQAFDARGVVETSSDGTAGRIVKFTGTDKIADSSIADTGAAVTVDVPTTITGDLTVANVGAASSKVVMQVGGGSYTTSLVATAGDSSLALSLPSKAGVTTGTVLADFSVIDGGSYD
jgi:hypothetical protein